MSTAHSDKVAAGDVISQSPEKGTGVKGDKITLKRSLGPVLVDIPATRGKTVAAATKLLKDAGFTVAVRPVAVNYIGAGLVVTSPPGRRQASPQGLDGHPLRDLSSSSDPSHLRRFGPACRCRSDGSSA